MSCRVDPWRGEAESAAEKTRRSAAKVKSGIDDCADFFPRTTGFFISNILNELAVPNTSVSFRNYTDFGKEYQGKIGERHKSDGREFRLKNHRLNLIPNNFHWLFFGTFRIPGTIGLF